MKIKKTVKIKMDVEIIKLTADLIFNLYPDMKVFTDSIVEQADNIEYLSVLDSEYVEYDNPEAIRLAMVQE